MKKIFSLLGGMFLFVGTVSAQVTGAVSYSSLAAAISALNTQGVGAGGATVTITANETAPAGGYILGSATLNSSLSAANPLVIDGGGVTITAGVGTSTSLDAILKLAGVDYVTIQNFTFTDAATNTTATQQAEWGIALVKRQATAPFDGCQNVTIQNNTIDLVRTNTSSVGIYSGNHIATSTTALTITATTDAMNNLKVYSNTIQDVNTGIRLQGFSSAASPYTLYDQGNDIGGISVATRNTIQNYGGTSAGQGINLQYQNAANVSFNKVDNAGGTGGIGATATHRSIYVQNGTNVSATVNNNRIIVAMGSTTSGGYGIDFAPSGTGTVTINNDTVTMTTAGSSGLTYGIQIANTGPVVCNGNRLRSWSLAGTGSAYGIYVLSNTTNLTVINNATDGAATPYFTRTGSSGTTYIFYNNASAASGTHTITGNNFSEISLGTSTSTFYGLYDLNGTSSASPSKTYSNNTVTNCTNAGSGSFAGMVVGYMNGGVVTGNTVTNLSSGGTLYGIQLTSYCIGVGCYSNTINTLTATGASSTVYGINASGTSSVDTIRNHNIYGITATGASGSVAGGVLLSAGTAHTVYNNMISGLSNAAGSNVTGVAGINQTGGTVARIFHNTIVLGFGSQLTSSGASFGAVGIGYSSTSTDTIMNNIVWINALAKGTGRVIALRRSAAGTAGSPPAMSNLVANNNIYRINVDTANYIYAEGTTNTTLVNGFAISGAITDATRNLVNDPNFNTSCGLYKAFMGGRESASFSEDNLMQVTPNVYTPSGASYAESSAATTNPAVSFDLTYDPRAVPGDIGAEEFAGTAPNVDVTAPSVVYSPVSNSYCMPAGTITASITDASGVNTSPGTAPRMYYKKTTDANTFAGNTPSDNGYKFVEGVSTGGNQFTFTPDYSLLQSPLVPGDTIEYFIVAQDLAASPNVAINQGTFASGFCANTVALTAAAFPLQASPAPRRYVYLTAPTLTLTPSSSTLCNGGAVVLTTTGAVTDTSVNYLYESAPGGSATFTPVSGLTGASDTTAILTPADNGIQYRVSLRCGSTVVSTTNVVSIAVTNPAITSTSPATRCGLGTVTIGAAGSGAQVNYYSAATGGTLLGTGNTYTTPVISSTTDYFVSTSTPYSANSTVGLPPAPQGCGTVSVTSFTDYPIRFTTTGATVLNSVVVVPQAAGQFVAALRASGSSTNILTDTFTFTAGQVGVPTTIVLNDTIPTAGAYQLTNTVGGGSRISAYTCGYPFTSQAGTFSIVGSASGSTSSTSTTQYNIFYNLNISETCESPRSQVTATVTQAPQVSLTASSTGAACGGAPFTLTAMSANSGYTYTYSPGGQTGATITVTPANSVVADTLNYTVTATDNSAGPNAGCVDTAQIRIPVVPSPSPITVTPASTTIACGSGATQIFVTRGPGERRDTITNGTLTSATTSTPYKSNLGGNKVQLLYLASDITAQGLGASSRIDSLGFIVNSHASGTYTFNNFTIRAKLTSTASLTTSFETGMTEVLAPQSFTLTGTTPFQILHGLTRPIIYDGTSNLLLEFCYNNMDAGISGSSGVRYRSTTGVNTTLYSGADNSAGVCDTLTGTTGTSQPSLLVRFSTASVTFRPTAGLFTDAATTMPYVAGANTDTVYARPSSNIDYVATAAASACTQSDTAQFIVTGTPTALANESGSTDTTRATQNALTVILRNADCELLATVTQTGGAAVSGNMTTKVYIDDSVKVVANGQPYVQRHFEINPDSNASTATATVTLYATQAEFDAYNAFVTTNMLTSQYPVLPSGGIDNGNVRVTKYSGTSTTGEPGSYVPGVGTLINPTVAWNSTNNWWEITFTTTGFSGFFIHSGDAAPLELTGVTIAAANEGARNRAVWTANGKEVEGLRYTLERSTDGRSFANIESRLAAGTGTEYVHYDLAPFSGTNYYRVRATDVTGRSVVSRIASAFVATGNGFAVQAFPNPVAENGSSLTVRVQGTVTGVAEVTLTDATGKLLRRSTLSGTDATFDISGLPGGLYLVRYTDGARTETVKVTKQ